MKKTIVDFATTEVVRGSFGYDSYLLYSALKSRGEDVTLLEDITPTQLHKQIGENSDEWYIHFWSYPQKVMINWAKHNLRGEKKYIGYKPLIEKTKLPFANEWDNETLYDGMKNLPNILHEFKYGLMSDCDEHIKNSGMNKVMPLFLSYGCPNLCKFCPIPVNRKDCKPKRLELSIQDCESVLDKMQEKGYTNIHFCDEDFFMNVNRAEKLVDKLYNMKNIKYIALASVKSFYDILNRVGVEKLLDSGLQVVELGLETNDVDLRKQMKKTGTINQLEKITSESKLKDKVFYLSVSLFPGETIKSIKMSGEFLKKYGPDINKISSRIKANSSQGGLGQFFQPYDGSYKEGELDKLGMFLEKNNPIRLIPSFVPYSLLNEYPTQINNIKPNEKFWFNEVYNINIDKFKDMKLDGTNSISKLIDKDSSKLIYIMLLARLGKLK